MPVCCCVMWITTTRRMTGRNGASWKRTPQTGAAQLVEIRETAGNRGAGLCAD